MQGDLHEVAYPRRPTRGSLPKATYTRWPAQGDLHEVACARQTTRGSLRKVAYATQLIGARHLDDWSN